MEALSYGGIACEFQIEERLRGERKKERGINKKEEKIQGRVWKIWKKKRVETRTQGIWGKK